jgi:dTDP-4-amino-4,6-dideoxygalactose transaminase
MTDCWRKKYEEEFCKYVDAQGARAFGLGRHALVILLKALGVNQGDKIGVCSFTCLSVIEAVKVCQATPVYLDVDECLCIDPQEILIQDNGSLKVVILQHTFGNPGRLEQLLTACNKIGAKVVEDCAHSLGCSWNNKKLGKWGDGAIYSFQWGKPYTTGQGGMLTVNSGRLLDKVERQIEQFAAPASVKSEFILACQRLIYPILGQSWLECYLRYYYSRLRNRLVTKEVSLLKDSFPPYQGFARLAGEMTAKRGLKQLENWHKNQQIRLQNTAMIEEYFNKAGLPLWSKQPQANITMLRYPFLTHKKWEIIHQAGKCGLDIAGWYASPVHPLSGDDLAKVDYHQGCCLKVEDMIERLVHLPTGASLNKHRLEAMMKIITTTLNGD